MRKLIVPLLVLSLLTSIFSACAPPDTNPPAVLPPTARPVTATDKTATAASPAADLDPTGSSGTPVASTTATAEPPSAAIATASHGAPTGQSAQNTDGIVKPVPTIAPTIPPERFTSAILDRVQLPPIAAVVPSSYRPHSEASFADFRLPAISIPTEPASEAIDNSINELQQQVLLSDEQQAQLARNQFVATPGEYLEFFEVYERARYNYQPAFITSDSLLHSFYLVANKVQRDTERLYLTPMLTKLNYALMQTTAEQYEELQGTVWAEAAWRNAAYFAVAVSLLDPEWQVPEGLREIVAPDLENIRSEDAEPSPSAIFPNQEAEDWSQYKPRGHYAGSDDLGRYFQAMMWHGRIALTDTPQINERQAVLLALSMRDTTLDGRSAAEVWLGIYDTTRFFVGETDDLTPLHAIEVLEQIYGIGADLAAIQADESKLSTYRQELIKFGAALARTIGEDDAASSFTTLRFMGQRVTPDAFVLKQLVSPTVSGRLLPSGLDVFAALGSERAEAHLALTGDTEEPQYAENMQGLQERVAGYDEQEWTRNLYWSWLYSLQALLGAPDERYPDFMRSDAWLDKQLQTSLGAWTQIRQSAAPLIKQFDIESGIPPPLPPDPELPRGYVEPVPLLYARVAAAATMLKSGLSERGLIADSDAFEQEGNRSARLLDDLIGLAEELQRLAEKQLRGDPLTNEEYSFINSYGLQLEDLTFDAANDDLFGGIAEDGADPPQVAIVTDVATDNDGGVLHVALGRVSDIYVIVPVDGQPVVARGGIYSFYEFTRPPGTRLTNEEWRVGLDRGEREARPVWTNSFVVEQDVGASLDEAIIAYSDAMVRALWFGEPAGEVPFTEVKWDVPDLVEGEALAAATEAINTLVANQQFIGRQRIAINFRSYDFSDQNTAVVSTQERWFDGRYAGTAYDYYGAMSPADIPVESVRGPYLLDVTYTLKRRGDKWLIIQVVEENQPPEWSQP